MSVVLIIFCVLAAVTLATAFMTIFSKNPIHSALYLVVCFFSIAGHYLLLNSQFLAIVHVIVFWGDYDFVPVHDHAHEPQQRR
jgi:NADH-quinone oxidoreductase subunit J